MTTETTTLREKLIAMEACEEAIEWVGDRTLAQAWAECRESTWMFWWLGRCAGVGKKQLVLAACACARLSLPYAGGLAAAAIEAAEEWARGTADLQKVRSAAAFSYSSGAAVAAAAAVVFSAAKAAVSSQQSDIVREYFPTAPERRRIEERKVGT